MPDDGLAHAWQVFVAAGEIQLIVNRHGNHPGELIDRKELFRQVWDTAYTVDTRTLDVHISWLRQAIEEDPRRPKYIKTIRGMGYRLDLEGGQRPPSNSPQD